MQIVAQPLKLPAPKPRQLSSAEQSLASNDSMKILSSHNVTSNASFIDTHHNGNLPSSTIPVETSNHQQQSLSQFTNPHPLPITSALQITQPLSQQPPIRFFARRGRPRKNAYNQVEMEGKIDISTYTPPSNLNIQYGSFNARGCIKRKDTSNHLGFQLNGQVTKREKSSRGRDSIRSNRGGSLSTQYNPPKNFE